MASNKSSTPAKGPTQGGRQEYKRTGTAPTPANTGAGGKATTPKPY
jgi:hypothetical protein